MGTLHEDLITLMILSHSVLLTMRNVSDKSCRENQNTHFMLNDFFSKNSAMCEKMRQNIAEPDRLQMTIRWLCIALWITKATDTHSEYLIFIAFPWQQWLHKCASLLHLQVHCLSGFIYKIKIIP
jgi:hypothetical protein